MALILGAAIAIIFGNPHSEITKKITPKLLAWSIVGLGAGMNLSVIAQVGLQGIGYTVIGITITFLLGYLLSRFLKVEKDVSLLITIGTAICGGSAIAALAPAIRAKSQDISVALGTVFLLNAAALVLFPWIGHQLSLSEAQFGLWAALAIHDTSSVVGAGLAYGNHALEVGTAVKLARALWIIPIVAFISFVRARQQKSEATTEKAKRPWFILGFIFTAALVTWIPELQSAGHVVEIVAKKALVLTLFLIGSNLTLKTLQSVGIRPFILGLSLWFVMASGTLAAVYYSIVVHG